MRIRDAGAGDRDGWNPLWKGYQDYYEVDLSETTENTWRRLMAAAADGPFRRRGGLDP